ncbi:hypothetical protein MBM_08377 [Drepanopeziza brunnea f. sp. 'multigermtubi' MB_m1]|uniref:Uncharacterized protein n=1 Tax=Marssonina brunnea f. sp. multigermtubi (strain MB_m1) TaxID=1072389 RepID=K1XMJ2_MARBU|nr:uncharacterized protein MBM_08377 [Drepanopeziza brunnea f. sp. 'multigermtubi' MB_m1]EKD13659.1 hypothetical protein MBM_08377 [Drepanopeziza brunnea f. sp. 'multigermtubi' MB_m1]
MLLRWPVDFRQQSIPILTEPVCIDLKLSGNELYTLSVLISSPEVDAWISQYGDISGWYRIHSAYLWALFGWEASWSEGSIILQRIIHSLMEDKIWDIWSCKYAQDILAKPATMEAAVSEVDIKAPIKTSAIHSSTKMDKTQMLKPICHPPTSNRNLWRGACYCYCITFAILALIGALGIAMILSHSVNCAQPKETTIHTVYMLQETPISVTEPVPFSLINSVSLSLTPLAMVIRTIAIRAQESSIDLTPSITIGSEAVSFLPLPIASGLPTVSYPDPLRNIFLSAGTCPVISQTRNTESSGVYLAASKPTFDSTVSAPPPPFATPYPSVQYEINPHIVTIVAPSVILLILQSICAVLSSFLLIQGLRRLCKKMYDFYTQPATSTIENTFFTNLWSDDDAIRQWDDWLSQSIRNM